MKKLKKLLVLLICLSMITGIDVPKAAEALTVASNSITTGNYQLSLYLNGSSYGVRVINGSSTLFAQEAPLMLYIYNSACTEVEYTSGYSSVSTSGTVVSATGRITTANGSVFRFDDTYEPVDDTGIITFSRNVTVESANSADVGFATRFGLVSQTSSSLTDFNMFAPGVWYKQNENTVDSAIASDYSDEYFFIKETRLTLPMFSMQKISTGDTLTFCHKDADLSTVQSEMSNSWLIDEGFQFGSIGIKKSPSPGLYFNYPSYEGEQNYYGNDLNGSIQRSGMIRRSHPVQTSGVDHSYSLYIRLGNYSTFDDMEGDNWQYFYNKYDPDIISIDPNLLYSNGMEVLSTYFKDDFAGEGAGLPWSEWTLADGTRDYHLQSGFVGQQTKAGWLLFRDGLKNNNSDNIEKGMKIIDFWANNSMTTAGIPKTDYFCEWNNGYGGWSSDPIFLRTASDGCEGVLEAYNTGLKYGTIKQTWLDYCKLYGDFLVSHQNSDGSWARSYNEDGSIVNSAKYNTTNAIRFMVRLYVTTGVTAYRTAAVAAGEWSLSNIDALYKYVGGTTDNDNTIDKEAGVMALNAFNALYDLTGESRWLDAAVNAGNYSESWVYSYNYDAYPATRWAASGSSYPQWLKVDLQGTYSLTRVETMFEFTNCYYQYTIETSLDGTNWTTFADRSQNTARPYNMGYVDTASAQSARYVRINMTGVEGSGAWASIYEFKVYTNTSDNLAQNKPTTVSSQQDSAHAASYATDGVVTSSSSSPWPDCGIVGQSLVATGHSYTDTYMMAAPAEYFRLYLYTGNSHYLDVALILANNTNAVADYDGRLGYQNKALMGEGVMANNFSVFYGTECLTWQLAVQLEAISTLQDMFGNTSIQTLVNSNQLTQLASLNHYSAPTLNLTPVSSIENGGIYCIVNKNSGKLLDVQGASMDNSANIWQYHYINGNGQKWKAIAVGDGSWEFQNVNSGKVIDVEAASTSEGGNISQYTNSHTANQQWYLEYVDSGYQILINKNSNLALDVENYSYLDGANISQFTNYETVNQKWKFYQIN